MSRTKINPIEACKNQYLGCRMECPAKDYDDCINIHVRKEKCAFDERWGTFEERYNRSEEKSTQECADLRRDK